MAFGRLDAAIFAQGALDVPLFLQDQGQIVTRLGIVRIEVRRFAELREGRLTILLLEQNQAQDIVRLGRSRARCRYFPELRDRRESVRNSLVISRSHPF